MRVTGNRRLMETLAVSCLIRHCYHPDPLEATLQVLNKVFTVCFVPLCRGAGFEESLPHSSEIATELLDAGDVNESHRRA
jgi:hypothetical protein